MTAAESYPGVLLALCLWREARGATREAKVAVKHVVLNRMADPKGPYAHCSDIVANVLCPRQFSSFNQSDRNASKLPNPSITGDWKAWLDCCAVVDSDEPDPTSGATHYFDTSIDPPAWAAPDKFTVQIDRFKFFKL